jgi:pimeloyl-ACP methyl ester carboxylesterase
MIDQLPNTPEKSSSFDPEEVTMQINLLDTVVGHSHYEIMRVLSTMPTQGAELGEVVQTAHRIKDGDFDNWIQEWTATADRVATIAQKALQKQHFTTARQAFLRASNYYRAALFYAIHTDPRHKKLWMQGRECFHQAILLMSSAPEIIEIPFGDARLPGYFIKGGEGKRPTLLALGGFDSSMEELIHWIGFASAERGWNCLAFEGPGQWSALYLNPGLTLRHDYEVPMQAIVDYVVQRPDVDSERLALIGYSLGGYLAPRAASFEPRIRACITDCLVTEIGEAFRNSWPLLLRDAPTPIFDAAFAMITKINQHARWSWRHCQWTMGLTRPSQFFNTWKPYTLTGLEGRLQCPLLCLFGEDEINQQGSLPVFEASAHYLSELKCDTTFHIFPRSQGAGAHCQIGGLTPGNDVIFDWLDKIFSPEQAQRAPAFHNVPQLAETLRRYHGRKVEGILSRYKLFADALTSA